MNILDSLNKNEKGNIIMNRANVALLMIYIMENKISNVGHFITKELNLGITGYNSAVKRYQTEFPEFYNYYNSVLEKSKEEVKDRIKDALVYIGLLMKNGIKLEDGTFREFDLFDWFIIKNRFFDNLNRKEITKIIDEFIFEYVVYTEDLPTFEIRKFISGAYGDSLKNYSEPVYKSYAYNYARDLLTEEEVDKLLYFMNLHNIPLNQRNFDFGIDKMINQRNNPNNLFVINNNISDNKVLARKRR